MSTSELKYLLVEALATTPTVILRQPASHTSPLRPGWTVLAARVARQVRDLDVRLTDLSVDAVRAIATANAAYTEPNGWVSRGVSDERSIRSLHQLAGSLVQLRTLIVARVGVKPANHDLELEVAQLAAFLDWRRHRGLPAFDLDPQVVQWIARQKALDSAGASH